MAKSVFAMRLVNLRSVTCYTHQTFKTKRSFCSSKYLYLEKKVKESFKTCVNLKADLHVDFVLQHFNLRLFVNENDEETKS